MACHCVRGVSIPMSSPSPHNMHFSLISCLFVLLHASDKCNIFPSLSAPCCSPFPNQKCEHLALWWHLRGTWLCLAIKGCTLWLVLGRKPSWCHLQKPSQSQQQEVYGRGRDRDVHNHVDCPRAEGVTYPDKDQITTHKELGNLNNWRNREEIRFNSSKVKVLPFGVQGEGFFSYKLRIHRLDIMKEGGQCQFVLVHTSATHNW